MKLERPGENEFLLTDGAGTTVRLNRTNYEDIFYCVPIDNPSLFLLINDTILDDTESRKAFKKLVDDGGGMDKALADLQEQVKILDPTKSFGPAKPPPPPKPEIIKIAPEGTRKPTAAIRVAPVVTAPVVATPAAQKPAAVPPPLPAAPTKKAGPPAPGPATPAAPAKTSGILTPMPTAAPPAKAPPSPPSGVKKPSAVLPAAAMPEQKRPSGVLPAVGAGAPAKPAAGKPSTIIRPPAKPATSAGPMPFKPAAATPDVVITRSPNGAWLVAFQGLGVTLTPEKYESLFNSLPMNTGALFSLLFTNVLQGAENKATFRDMIKKGGAMKTFLDMFQKAVQGVSPHK
ncbi:MAG: hypothetical protein HYY93_06330 [Planctomycetes bacterium]|nr:hypothetical protein [Planctomycetota bacterium]